MEELYDSLGKLSDRTLAYAELKNDLLFQKIPKDKINYYVDDSLFLGKNKAKKYLEKDLKKLCEDNGVKIEIVKKSGTFYGVKFRAEISFSKKENIIKIYENSLIDLMNTCNKVEFFKEKLSYEDVFNMHLAHEFYHFLEYKENKQTNKLLDHVTLMNFGFLKRKASIIKCSEIAAHSFSKEILGANFLPNIYDYLYLIKLDKISLKDFRKMVTTWEQELDNKL